MKTSSIVLMVIGFSAMGVGIAGSVSGNDSLTPVALGLFVVGIIIYSTQSMKKSGDD